MESQKYHTSDLINDIIFYNIIIEKIEDKKQAYRALKKVCNINAKKAYVLIKKETPFLLQENVESLDIKDWFYSLKGMLVSAKFSKFIPSSEV